MSIGLVIKFNRPYTDPSLPKKSSTVSGLAQIALLYASACGEQMVNRGCRL